jgi:hypothetical protein
VRYGLAWDMNKWSTVNTYLNTIKLTLLDHSDIPGGRNISSIFRFDCFHQLSNWINWHRISVENLSTGTWMRQSGSHQFGQHDSLCSYEFEYHLRYQGYLICCSCWRVIRNDGQYLLYFFIQLLMVLVILSLLSPYFLIWNVKSPRDALLLQTVMKLAPSKRVSSVYSSKMYCNNGLAWVWMCGLKCCIIIWMV